MNATTTRAKRSLVAVAGALLFACAPAYAQQADAPDDGAKPEYARQVDHDTVPKASEDDIARESENPIGNLTVLPLENYTNFGFGPHDGTQNILEFEPVVPVHLGQDWTLINRAIIPAVWKSGSVAVPERAAGDRADQFFLVPLAEPPL